MDGFSILVIGLIVTAISYGILYFVIKSAVRDGILESRENPSKEDSSPKGTISQVACPKCGKFHDMDYPKCPYCHYSAL